MEIDGIPARRRVTHPSINRDRRRVTSGRRVTSFMRRTTLATVLRADAAPGSRRYRSISPAGRAHSSKPAAATDNMEQQHTATVLRPLCRSTGVSQQLQLETGGFVGAQFFCPWRQPAHSGKSAAKGQAKCRRGGNFTEPGDWSPCWRYI